MVLSCRVVDCGLSQSVFKVCLDSPADKILCHLNTLLIVFDQSCKKDGSLLVCLVLDQLGINVEPFKFLLDCLEVASFYSLDDAFLLLSRRSQRSVLAELESLFTFNVEVRRLVEA